MHHAFLLSDTESKMHLYFKREIFVCLKAWFTSLPQFWDRSGQIAHTSRLMVQEGPGSIPYGQYLDRTLGKFPPIYGPHLIVWCGLGSRWTPHDQGVSSFKVGLTLEPCTLMSTGKQIPSGFHLEPFWLFPIWLQTFYRFPSKNWTIVRCTFPLSTNDIKWVFNLWFLYKTHPGIPQPISTMR